MTVSGACRSRTLLAAAVLVFAALAAPTRGAIVAITPNGILHDPVPPGFDVSPDATQGDLLQAFDELQGLLVGSTAFQFNVIVPALGNIPISLAPDVRVSSHFLFFDPDAPGGRQLDDVTVTFDGPVLDIISADDRLFAGHGPLGLPQVLYPATEIAGYGPSLGNAPGDDTVSVVGPLDPLGFGRSITLSLQASTGDFLRVITGFAEPVPEPATLALLALGLAGAGLARRYPSRARESPC